MLEFCAKFASKWMKWHGDLFSWTRSTSHEFDSRYYVIEMVIQLLELLSLTLFKITEIGCQNFVPTKTIGKLLQSVRFQPTYRYLRSYTIIWKATNLFLNFYLQRYISYSKLKQYKVCHPPKFIWSKANSCKNSKETETFKNTKPKKNCMQIQQWTRKIAQWETTDGSTCDPDLISRTQRNWPSETRESFV